MCNTSIFQQTRKFNRLAEITGCRYLRHTQLTPRKFEVILEGKPFSQELKFYVYFGDTEVTFKEVGVKMKWIELN